MTYEELIVIDELLVGPVTITSKRIEAPYTVTRGGSQDQNKKTGHHQRPRR